MILHRLTANQESLTEIVRDNQLQMKEFSKTLININSNITHLNNSSEDMRKDLNYVQKELKDVKKNEERGKFDVVEFISKDVPKYIGLAILAAILMYIGLK